MENSEKIKEIFQTVGKTTGSIWAFPIVPDEISGDKEFLNAIKIHTTNGCFTDFYMDGKTTSHHDLDSHSKEIFDDLAIVESRKNTFVNLTFTLSSRERAFNKKEMLQIADIAVPEKLYTVSDIRKGCIKNDVDILKIVI